MPIMPWSGVRISWDITAKNSDFARFAASASIFARSRSTVRSLTRSESSLSLRRDS